jgi:hypothetical protein
MMHVETMATFLQNEGHPESILILIDEKPSLFDCSYYQRIDISTVSKLASINGLNLYHPKV